MSTRDSVLLITSNGAGMGHLARQLAVAIAGSEQVDSTILSMSRALPTILGEGVRGEYAPGPDRDWIPAERWPHYLAARIGALAREVRAQAVVFDGVAPYRGITLARRQMRDVPFVWFRRGMWREGVNGSQLWKGALFDAIIEPGDISRAADRGLTASRTDAVRISPVSLVEVVTPLPRHEAARALGLDPARPAVLMTLGTGRLGDVATPGATILDALLEVTDWQIGVVRSSIADMEIPVHDHARIFPVKGVFPLARYLSAFDAAVSAAGYNSVHELIPSRLPTLLIPNLSTRTDDQRARAREAERLGVALVAEPGSPRELKDGVEAMADAPTRDRILQAIAALPDSVLTGGAAQTATRLLDLATSFQPSALSPRERMAEWRDDGKESLKRFLGPGGTNRVRRALGRPTAAAGERVRVTVGEVERLDPTTRSLRFMESPGVADLEGPDPVEHIVAGASGPYRSARELIAGDFFEIVSPG